ncbi:MAG: YkgJ family cysteine cluster protein [Dehalococcoidia bacterium]|nr:YkgJ family cysteine cluster protein [Dehalococcoidia bacterium]
MKVAERCTGQCCERFTLPFSWKHAARMREQIKNGARTKIGRAFVNYTDIRYVLDMIIPLGDHTYHPATKETWMDKLHHYTCRHYDRDTGNCKSYEKRPSLCREYPNGRLCEYQGCTMRLCATK